MSARRIGLLPFVVVCLGALGALKAGDVSVSLAAASAEPGPVPEVRAASVSADRLVEQLRARERALDARESELGTREKVLAAAEARVDAAVKALAAEKQALANAGEGAAKMRRDELSALSAAYERMKPRDAARIFEILDDDILLPVAAGMRTQALAGVLAEMSAERARSLTVALADRGASAPAAEPAQSP